MRKNTRSKFKLKSIVLIVTMILPLFTTNALISCIKKKNQRGLEKDKDLYGEFIDDFEKTRYGRPIRMKFDKNPIPVVIDTFDENSKQYIIDGINALDEISENINYTIYDSSEKEFSPSDKIIKISILDSTEYENKHGTISSGKALMVYNNFTATIEFPIQIDINEKMCDGYWDNLDGESILTTVVKHELMHTLGFRDLYETEDKKRSIMYFQICPGSPQTFTEEDVQKIQQIYDGKSRDTDKEIVLKKDISGTYAIVKKDDEELQM